MWLLSPYGGVHVIVSTLLYTCIDINKHAARLLSLSNDNAIDPVWCFYLVTYASEEKAPAQLALTCSVLATQRQEGYI